MTQTASAIHLFASRNAEQVSDILDTNIPLLATIPFVGKKIDNTKLSKLQNLSKTVINVSTQAATLTQLLKQLAKMGFLLLALYECRKFCNTKLALSLSNIPSTTLLCE